MEQQKTAVITVAILVPALVLGLVFSILLLGSDEPDPCAPASGQTGVTIDPSSVPDDTIAGYGHDQLVNAAYIMQAAADLGLSVRDQTIGVMTAMGESALTVIDYGDAAGPDSRGLFQQRDNGAWGTYEQRMDPYSSATSFFNVLTTVADRDSLEPTLVANRVQRNADPYHYTQYWSAAVQVVEALSGVHAVAAAENPVTSQYSLGDVKPQTAALANSIGPMFGLKTIGGYRANDPYPDHPSGLALDLMINDIDDGTAVGDKMATYLQDNAEQLGIDYIIWSQRIWTADRSEEGWVQMEDRGGTTANHYDHVHVNVKADATGTLPAACDTTTPAAAGSDGWTSPGAGPITSPFGTRVDPIAGVQLLHGGTDLAAGGCDGPIYAAHDGTVIFSGFDTGGNGTITVDHGEGIQTSYLHMYASGILVNVGDKVIAGQQIAKVGSSGQSTGCHLHYAVRVDGSPVDPEPFMTNLGITLG